SPDALNATDFSVILDYTPTQAGTIVLAVQAYSNNISGPRVQRTVTVLAELDPGSGGAANTMTVLPPSPTQYNPTCRARVNVTELRLRTGPSIAYDIILYFQLGDEPQITGYAINDSGERWWRVIWGTSTGWTSAAYTAQLGDCSRLQPVPVPATPTPVPSATPQPTQPGSTATPTLPDLRLSLLTGPVQVQLGADGTFTATYVIEVENVGGQDSGRFRVAILRPDGDIEFHDVVDLGAGGRTLVPLSGLSYTFRTPGVVRLLVTVDDQYAVTESNETNNQTYTDITVSFGPATYTPVPTQGSNTGGDTDTGNDTVYSPYSPITAQTAGGVVRVEALSGHGGAITGVAFAPGGTRLASSSRDGTVRVWDAATGREVNVLAGHTDRVTDVAFSPDGSRLASSSWDGTIRLWDVNTGAELASYAHGAQADYVAFSPDGSRIASGGVNPEAAGGLAGLARVWEIGSGAELAGIEVFGPVSGVVLINNGTLVIATQGQDCALGGGGITFYEVSSGAEITELAGHSGWIDGLAVSPGGALIAGSGQSFLCAGDGTVWIWSGSGSLVATLPQGSLTKILALAFNPAGDLVATAGADGAIRLWALSTATLRAQLGTSPAAVDGVAFSTDGVWFGSGGYGQAVEVWAVQ
ncbi:MAG: hypothetical protein JXQ72_03480, partial [Anaerolineae bacterium]|nr:hypothetical protein [Anaerolineae bacterium]